MTLSMALRLSSDTLAVPFRKRDTVAADTPATRATSWTVTMAVLDSFLMLLV
jgi:hypothetical protein